MAGRLNRKQLFIELVLNGLLPWLVFSWLTEARHWSEYHGLLAITVIPSAVGIYGFWRDRRVDAIAILSLISILIGLLMTAATSDVRLLQIRESYLTLIFGILFLGSVLARRPVLYWMAVCQAQRQGTGDQLRAAWSDPKLRRFFAVITGGWGVTLVVEFAAKLWLIENLPVAQVLAWSPVVLYGITGLAMIWTLGYSYLHRRRRNHEPIYCLAPESNYGTVVEEPRNSRAQAQTISLP